MRGENSKSTNNIEHPLVSIIIPTYNSEKTLHIALESIKRQTYSNIEVIVIDNFSKDRTVEIARGYGGKVIQVRGERAKAKNIGLNYAMGKYVLFIDSDMELTPRVVEECVELAESNPRLAGIIIPERSVGNNYWAKVRDFERSFYIGTPIESPRFFRRDLALLVGGFEEGIVFYEEATLPLKLEKIGYKVWARINSPILHHEEELTLARLLIKRYYYAKTAKKYLKEYGSIYSGRIHAQIDPFYRFKLYLADKRFWDSPRFAIGLIVMKSLEYVISVVGYLFAAEGNDYKACC